MAGDLYIVGRILKRLSCKRNDGLAEFSALAAAFIYRSPQLCWAGFVTLHLCPNICVQNIQKQAVLNRSASYLPGAFPLMEKKPLDLEKNIAPALSQMPSSKVTPNFEERYQSTITADNFCVKFLILVNFDDWFFPWHGSLIGSSHGPAISRCYFFPMSPTVLTRFQPNFMRTFAKVLECRLIFLLAIGPSFNYFMALCVIPEVTTGADRCYYHS